MKVVKKLALKANVISVISLMISPLKAHAATGGISASQISQIAGGLVLVVLVIFWGAWIAKKLKFGNQLSGNGLIKIIAHLPVGTREKLMLVMVGDEQILLASGPRGIKHIHTLQTPIVIAEKTAQNNQSFAAQLSKILKRDKANNDNDNSDIS